MNDGIDDWWKWIPLWIKIIFDIKNIVNMYEHILIFQVRNKHLHILVKLKYK